MPKRQGDPPNDAPPPAAHHAGALLRPSPAALARAAPLFAQLLHGPGAANQAASTSAATATPNPASLLDAAASSREPVGATRHYPLAAAALARSGIAVPRVAEVDLAPGVDAAPGAVTPATTVPGAQAAWVRASVPAPKTPPPVSQHLLEEVAHAAQIGAGDEHTDASFAIVFREELLGELQCTVRVAQTGAMTATFAVADAHTARLLAAEAGRLRLQFEARGLRDVRVVIEEVLDA